MKNHRFIKNGRYETGLFSDRLTREREIMDKWTSSRANRMSLICHAASCQIKYIVWWTVFLKLAKIKEIDRTHSRETDNPDTGPLSRPPDFDIDTCTVSIFTDAHYSMLINMLYFLLKYNELTVIHREIKNTCKIAIYNDIRPSFSYPEYSLRRPGTKVCH